MMVNPSGVQLDMLNSVAGDEDQSVDWVWDSAGHLTATGYAVEIRLPLAASGSAAARTSAWGCCSGAREPGRRVGRLAAARAGQVGVREARRAGISDAPAASAPRRHSRVAVRTADPRARRRLGRADRQSDVGISAKIGMTPTVTLDATVNPDFSQVESDAFQVEVNQRFPVFFSEKRPFFMEGAGIFDLAGDGQRQQPADGRAHAPHHRSRWSAPS